MNEHQVTSTKAILLSSAKQYEILEDRKHLMYVASEATKILNSVIDECKKGK